MGWFNSVIDVFNSATRAFENWLDNLGSDASRLADMLSKLCTVIEDIAGGGHANGIEVKLSTFDVEATDYAVMRLAPVELAIQIKALMRHPQSNIASAM